MGPPSFRFPRSRLGAKVLGLFGGRHTILRDSLQTLRQCQLRFCERIQIEERLRVKAIHGGIARMLGHPTRAQDARRFEVPVILKVLGKPADLPHRDEWSTEKLC